MRAGSFPVHTAASAVGNVDFYGQYFWIFMYVVGFLGVRCILGGDLNWISSIFFEIFSHFELDSIRFRCILSAMSSEVTVL